MSRSQSTSLIKSDNVFPMDPFQGTIIEPFTFGEEEIQLFSNQDILSCPTSPTKDNNDDTLSQQSDNTQYMSYDKNFQLSPPPSAHRRKQSLKNNNSFRSCIDKQSVKLTRSASFSSIIHNI